MLLPLHKACILVLLMLYSSHMLRAQRLPFYNLSIEQGLIQSQAMCLEQDRIGHLWIGTLGGLSRWDGHQFSNYTVRDGLPSNTIYSLRKGSGDSLWIGTTKGLSLYDGHTFRNFTFSSPDNPQGNVVTAIEAAGTMLWCIAGGQLYQLINGKVKLLPLPDADVRSLSLFHDRDDALWVGTFSTGSTYRLYRNSWEKIPLINNAKTAYSFFQDDYRARLSAIGIITNKGIQQYAGGHDIFKFQPEISDAGRGDIRRGVQSGRNDLWFSATNGAYRFSGGKYIHYGRKEGFTDNRINALLADREGNVWFASDGQGIYRYSGAPFTILDESCGLGSSQISAFAADKKGSLYLGTYEAGIYRFNAGKLSETRFPKGAAASVMASAFGKVWAGTRADGLFFLEGDTWIPYPRPTFKNIGALYEAVDGSLWIGGEEGAAILSKDSLHIMHGRSSGITDFYPLGRDSMLIASAVGLRLYTGGVQIPFITGGLADIATIQCMAGSGNILFFGTSDNGIIIYDRLTGRTEQISKPEGLRSDFIYNLSIDDDSNLWAGTGFGIHRIHFSKSGYSIAFYGQEVGMKGMESNHNATLKMSDGSIWFGTTGGAVHYQRTAAIAQSAPAVMISAVLLFGKAITDSNYFRGLSPFYEVPQALRLPYHENNLTFIFNGIQLAGSPLEYRYELSGLDAQWSAWSTVNTVNYSAMPPGKYSLRVQCRSGDGGIGSAKPYEFEIITPFHKTGLFRLLVLIGCIMLGIALQYYAARRRLARERMIEKLRRQEQAIIRQRTAEDFHDEVGNKITRINVMTSVLRSRLGAPSADVLRIIESIQDNAGQLYQGTRDILWSLKPSNDSLYENINRIIHFGQDLFGDTEVAFSANTPDESWKSLRLQMDASRNLIMIFKEALNNVLKHSAASEVTLETLLDKDMLIIKLKDNGKGFSPEEVAHGHGLDNMQNRAKRINGTLGIESSPGAGATFILTAKIPLMKG